MSDYTPDDLVLAYRRACQMKRCIPDAVVLEWFDQPARVRDLTEEQLAEWIDLN